MPKSKKPTTTIFYCCSFKSKKVTMYLRWNAVFVMIFFASVLAKFCPNQNLILIRSIAAQFSTSTNIQACLISTWLCLQLDTLKCILLYLFFTHSSLSNSKSYKEDNQIINYGQIIPLFNTYGIFEKKKYLDQKSVSIIPSV